MVSTPQVDGLARIPGYNKYHICRILSHRTASPHALREVLVLDGGRGKTMNSLVDRDRELPANTVILTLGSIKPNSTDPHLETKIIDYYNIASIYYIRDIKHNVT